MSRWEAWGRAVEDTAALVGYVACALFAVDVLCDFIAWWLA